MLMLSQVALEISGPLQLAHLRQRVLRGRVAAEKLLGMGRCMGARDRQVSVPPAFSG